MYSWVIKNCCGSRRHDGSRIYFTEGEHQKGCHAGVWLPVSDDAPAALEKFYV